MKKTKILFLPLIVLMVTLMDTSCTEITEEQNTYGISALWLNISDVSMGQVESFNTRFTTKDVVYHKSEDHLIPYTKNGGLVPEDNLTFPYTMANGEWIKVYEGITECDSILFDYNGKTYSTKGFRFPETRLIKVIWRVNSTGEGEFVFSIEDLGEIEQDLYVAKNQRYEKSDFFYPTLFCCDIRRNWTRYES